MAKAASVKRVLVEITSRLAIQKHNTGGVTSREVVEQFKKENHDIDKFEQQELNDIALMILAGRVTSMNNVDSNQSEMLTKLGLPTIVSLRLPDKNGRYRYARFDVRNLTPEMILAHKDPERSERKGSRRDALITQAEKFFKEGFGKKSFKDLLTPED